ncbi:hypothetical protein MYCTH_2308163 [Thermothelomyces thermophilus ATCC 42464]|uniref:AB hydrolase-1 domain-containing protein n=1 Tax=Thermothelomyces thermophilus (strain ATCC 42464 / BCRC 31852 / DSM 1799) TaxID=573729 RepID=G2QJD3_THET4|nr:uncharacterized protein MYCTH_2308163 [Thermothelomyces thermophilus ATCC 42464]AEO59690.1 hypothetical protein MYCTH_2308163 [Thermothelomyces thermophilus ATCC 42464]
MDCERAPLIEGKLLAVDGSSPPPAPWKNPLKNNQATKRRHPLRGFLKAILTISPLLLVTGYAFFQPKLPFRHPVQPPDPPQPVRYPGEHISWTPCGTIDNRALECANLTVPVDQFDTNSSVEASSHDDDDDTDNDNHHKHHQPGDTFTIPLLRLRSANATPSTRNLLLNPGGPGGSGAAFLYQRGAQLATLVGDGFHLLSFDPRGVNGSTPLATCYRSEEDRRALSSRARTARRPVEDSGELWAWTGSFVRACDDVMGGAGAGAHVNTPQTAADMNSILDAVGQRALYYWGFSYGTILGQTYATLFPDRAERVIIDGVANQFDWYESRLDAEMIADTDRVLEGFVDECVRAGEERCALAAMATSKEELLDLLLERVARLRDDPVGVYVNETQWGVLDYWTLWYNGVFPALYKPAVWGELADRLAALFRGNATAAWLAYGTKPAWDSLGDAFKFISINDGVSGPDKWPMDRLELLDYLLPFFNQSLFGEAQLDYYFSKQAWTIPHAHSYVPRRRVRTAHPLLILSTTYDPVCPLVSAKGAADVFERSRLVEVKGYGHCTLAVPSRCVARHVRDFLYDGKLPDDGHVRCEPDANPAFAKPEEADALLEAQSLSEEDRRVWKAQQELARDITWLGPWRGAW